ncbi:MAG TPA: fumarylacetoacetate hydrolase family protein [Acidobacteriota bacterium]|nr:fumarylacetoacetate hydrolase family protein [Acidobacteriota bacterium]
MRLASLSLKNRTCLGLVLNERVLILNELAKLDPANWEAFAHFKDVSPLWAESTRNVIAGIHARILADGVPPDWEPFCVRPDQCNWLPPVTLPEKIICIGLNYSDHAAESGLALPKEPVIFSKFQNALMGASGPVIIPANSTQVDYEAELAVIIGRKSKRVSIQDAMTCVGGYTILNDVSARDWQFRTGQWLSGKSFDTFAPCGPWLVTPDEVQDPHALGIRLSLNGRTMQDSNTRNLIFGVPTLISYISHLLTLRPGDIISTGTPAGVGFARRPPVFLRPGDVVEIEIDKLGKMRHACIAE